MKKAIALVLSLLMIAALSACGTQAEAPKETPTAPQVQDNVNTEPQETAVPTEALEPEATTEDATAFDTSWTDNEFEALLPELPFTGWSANQADDCTYKMELGGLNTSPATNSDDSAEPDGADKDRLIAYLNSLTDFGFTVEETAEGYKWLATDASGNTFEFMCAEGYIWITIFKSSIA